MAKKNFGPKILVFCYRDLALAVPVVLAPSEAFFDFSFPSYSRFREGTPQMRQNFVSRNCRNFAAMEGSPHENGYNCETKSPKRLPKVPKRPQRPGLVTKIAVRYQKTKIMRAENMGHFLVIFGQYRWKERYLSKTSFLPIFCLDKCNSKTECYCQNSKILFL